MNIEEFNTLVEFIKTQLLVKCPDDATRAALLRKLSSKLLEEAYLLEE